MFVHQLLPSKEFDIDLVPHNFMALFQPKFGATRSVMVNELG